MSGARLFVVTVASEKGGVGKTTLATNLAVYLKALAEDLTVTIASFDNHFSVDNMFAIGRQQGRSVAGLFTGTPAAELVQLGEYGVQYLASTRHLEAPVADPACLRAALDKSGLDGIFIIDTRPVIDAFTRSALAAADLLLVPVKDRPSLINASAVLEAYTASGGVPEHAWLVPSIVDARLRLRADIGVREFLTFSARERGLQVLDTYLAKSPKVESLATNLSSRVYPVLTHARQTVVHQQFREIADFVLAQRRATVPLVPPATEIAPGLRRRLVTECPLCGSALAEGPVHFLHDQRSRRRGGVHATCLQRLWAECGCEQNEGDPAGGVLFDLGQAGLSGPAEIVQLRWFSAQGEELHNEPQSLATAPHLEALLRSACGRNASEFFCDRLWLGLRPAPLVAHLHPTAYEQFRRLRRRVFRHAQESGDWL